MRRVDVCQTHSFLVRVYAWWEGKREVFKVVTLSYQCHIVIQMSHCHTDVTLSYKCHMYKRLLWSVEMFSIPCRDYDYRRLLWHVTTEVSFPDNITELLLRLDFLISCNSFLFSLAATLNFYTQWLSSIIHRASNLSLSPSIYLRECWASAEE